MASGHSVPFEIVSAENERQLTWSSFIRTVGSVFASTDVIRLVPLDGNNPDLSELEATSSGTTIGFYKNMPVKFGGAVVSNIIEDKTYYVSEIVNEILSDSVKGMDITQNGKELKIEETRDKFQCVIPGMRVFDAINWMGGKAIRKLSSGGQAQSGFIFYENRKSFCACVYHLHERRLFFQAFPC